MTNNSGKSNFLEILDTSVFDNITSETNKEDRLSLLALQRSISKITGTYAYLEIGSHLGGSIQPHLLHMSCECIISIDPRPLQQPDDRKNGFIAYYDENSTERMINNLSELDSSAVKKVITIEKASWEINKNEFKEVPDLALIDGEHTYKAVVSDFKFCKSVVNPKGVIYFHDYHHIHKAITDICRTLKNDGVFHIPVKLGGSIFAIFFDRRIIESDSYLLSLYHKNKYFIAIFQLRLLVIYFVKKPLRYLIRKILKIPPKS